MSDAANLRRMGDVTHALEDFVHEHGDRRRLAGSRRLDEPGAFDADILLAPKAVSPEDRAVKRVEAKDCASLGGSDNHLAQAKGVAVEGPAVRRVRRDDIRGRGEELADEAEKVVGRVLKGDVESSARSD